MNAVLRFDNRRGYPLSGFIAGLYLLAMLWEAMAAPGQLRFHWLSQGATDQSYKLIALISLPTLAATTAAGFVPARVFSGLVLATSVPAPGVLLIPLLMLLDRLKIGLGRADRWEEEAERPSGRGVDANGRLAYGQVSAPVEK